MGFSFKRFDYVGGSGSWGGNNAGTSTTAQRNRAEAVLKDFGDYIISCNRGWQIDTTHCANTSSFVEIPVENYNRYEQTEKAVSLFFENTISGYKLFLGICPYNSRLRLKSSFNNMWYYNNSGVSGIFLSISDGADFGLEFDDNFLPTTATYITGTSTYCTSNTYNLSYVSNAENGINYVYSLFVDEYCIGIGGNYSSTGIPICKPSIFVGRILGILTNQENLSVSKLGAFRLTNSDSGPNNEFYTNLNYYYNSSTYNAVNLDNLHSISMVFNSTGTRLCNSIQVNNTIPIVRLKGYDVILSSYVCNSEILNAVAWTPFKVVISSSDLEYCGAIPGFGFKGYLDTNLFRYAYCTTNKLYDSGHFIGQGDFDLLIGWDSNNTDTL